MKRVLFSTLFAVALVIGGASRPAQAQDAMMTHVCDSTLIALLYIAEHDYGFHSMQMDVSTFEKGQYGPLFDAMMASMSGDSMMATEESMMGTEDSMMATEEPMMGSMVTLTPATVEGEDSACTALRAELDSFFYTALTADMTMMGSGN